MQRHPLLSFCKSDVQIIAVSFPRIRMKRKKHGGRLDERSSSRKEGDIYPWNTTCCPVSVSLRLSLRIDTANRGTRFHISRGPCFHGGPRSISRSPIVDRERRFDAQNLLQGSQERRSKKREKRLASLAYRVSTSLFFFFFFLLFISICSSRGGTLFLAIAATLIVSRISWLRFLFSFPFFFFFFFAESLLSDLSNFL